MWVKVSIIGHFGVSPISVDTESYLIVFTPWTFFVGTYIVHTRISCVEILFFSITSQESGRNTLPVILPTIIFFFYQLYCVKHLLEHFSSLSLRNSTPIYLVIK